MRDRRDFGGYELREMLCFSIVSWLRRFAKAGPKNESCEGSAAENVDKICITSARAGDLEVKNVKKTGMTGALLEAELGKICTTPARESDLEVKIVKMPWFGALLEVELGKICTTPARETNFCEKQAPCCMIRALLGVELRKICATPAHESDLEVKSVKT